MNFSSLKHLLAAGVLAGSLFGTAALAVPISGYEGELDDGVTVFGLITEPDTGSPNDDFWWFNADAGTVITLTGHRLDSALDLAFTLYFGTGTDTDDLEFLAGGDDEIAELPGYEGPFADPELADFVLPYAGDYTVRVWSFLSGTLDSGLDINYQLTGYDTGHDVPAPAALGIVGLGLAGLGLARRRK